MRNFFGIVLYIFAGFFVYGVSLMSFVNQSFEGKWVIIVGFSLPALFFLSMGLTVNRFQKWKRDIGVVLLSGSGVTIFVVFTFVCLLMTDEFKEMMKPDTLDFFSGYTSGIIFILSVATLGIALLKSEKKTESG